MKKIILLLTLACGFQTMQSQEATKRDKKFVGCVAQADMMEVKLAALAQSNASSAEVKNLGKKLTDESTKDNLKSVASKNNIPYPTALTEKQQKMYDKMASLKGESFDKHYTKCMIKSHKKLLCKFKKEGKKGNNPELKAWATSNIPTIDNHKAAAQEACIKMKKK
jgi:putative membrane protein